jgi:hypothetical protein
LEAQYTLLEANPHFTSEDFRFTPPSGAAKKKNDKTSDNSGKSTQKKEP